MTVNVLVFVLRDGVFSHDAVRRDFALSASFVLGPVYMEWGTPV